MNRKDNAAFLMAEQFSFECEKQRLDIIKKAVDTCGNSGMPIPNERYFEALSNGIYHGPSCDCPRCQRIYASSRRKFQ